jgi:hypothetical protein
MRYAEEKNMPPRRGIFAFESVYRTIGTFLAVELIVIRPLEAIYGSSNTSCLFGIVTVIALLIEIDRLPVNDLVSC